MTHTPVTPEASEGSESLTQTTVRSTRVYHTADEGYAAFDTSPSISLDRILYDIDSIIPTEPDQYQVCTDWEYGWENAIKAVKTYLRFRFEIKDKTAK